MGMTDWSSDLEEAAREAAGNWKHFESFAWHHADDEGSENWTIVYTSNRDSGILAASNEHAIRKALKEFGEDVREERHNHWAVGHVDGFVVRVYDDEGQVTDAFRKLHEIAISLADYPVLDSGDYSQREYDAQIECIANEVSDEHTISYWVGGRVKIETYVKLPEGTTEKEAVDAVWSWLWETDQGAFYYNGEDPSVKVQSIAKAVEALGYEGCLGGYGHKHEGPCENEGEEEEV